MKERFLWPDNLASYSASSDRERIDPLYDRERLIVKYVA